MCACPLFCRASWYDGDASSNVCLLHEMLLSLALIEFGISLMTLGGWFEWPPHHSRDRQNFGKLP